MCFPCFPGDLWNPSNKCPWRAPGLALQWLAPGSAPLWVQSCSIDLPSSHSIWTGQRRTIWRSDAFASKLKRWPRGELRTRSNLYNQVFEGVDHNLRCSLFRQVEEEKRQPGFIHTFAKLNVKRVWIVLMMSVYCHLTGVGIVTAYLVDIFESTINALTLVLVSLLVRRVCGFISKIWKVYFEHPSQKFDTWPNKIDILFVQM